MNLEQVAGSESGDPGEDVVVIVAVEGPTAAGKTSWCRAQSWSAVAEYEPTGREPDGSDPAVQGAYWTAVSVERWSRAVALERDAGVVLCDSDPVKLHYSWCLARIGVGTWERFTAELVCVREAFEAGRLGLADLVVVSIPSPEVLRRQRLADLSRRRRSFELHARLAGPLREWFTAVERVDSGRVRWSFPERLASDEVEPRASRSDSGLLEEILRHLPVGSAQ